MKTSRLLLSSGIVGIFLLLGAGCITKPDNQTPPATSTNKRYVLTDVERCKAARFVCAKSETYFSDATGCGCQKVAVTPSCGNENKPVCAEIEVQCIKAPCPPLKQTFTNRCLAEEGGAKKITEGACPEVVSSKPLILVTPKANTSITSPLTLEGQAPGTWFFEGSFPVEIVDANGKGLGGGFVTSVGDWMTTSMVKFKGTATFKKGAATTGFVILKNDNPSGDPEKSQQVKIPVLF